MTKGPGLEVSPALDGAGIPWTHISTAAVNHGVLFIGAGAILHVSGFTNDINIGYLRLYDLDTDPTAGDGASCIYEAIIPANAGGSGFSDPIFFGKKFFKGLGYRLSGGIALSDATAVAANAFVINLSYITA